MAFSVKQVKAILSSHNIPVDELDKCAEEICSRHAADFDSIKEERDTYKKDAETLVSVRKELDDLKAAAEKDGKDPFKVKYEAIKEEYENYKKDQTAKETKAAKSSAYRALLKEAGISDKRLDAVLKVSDIDGIELDKDGKIKDAEKLTETIKSEWADFISTSEKKGAETKTPPVGGNNVKSREEIYAKDEHGRFKLDASERQAALAQLNAAESQQKG